MITQDLGNGSINILNERNLDFEGQTWTIQIVKRSTFSESENKEGIVQFNIEWVDPCLSDEVTTDSIIEDIVYQIGITEMIEETPVWTQTKPFCPLNFAIFL